MSSPTPEQPVPPQSLSEFEQQLCTQILDAQKAFSDQLAAQQKQFADAMAQQMKDQQARFQAQTGELMQSLMTGKPPPLPTAGESGQPQAAQKPAAPAGPT